VKIGIFIADILPLSPILAVKMNLYLLISLLDLRLKPSLHFWLLYPILFSLLSLSLSPPFLPLTWG